MHTMSLDHPKQRLVFYGAQDLNQSIRDDVQQFVSELAVSRVWSIAPPIFIDEMDGENSLQVVGGMLEIYSALPPYALPLDMDSVNLEEVEAMVDAVRALSEKENLSFEFQLDAIYVGCIEDGVIERTLQNGLIAPWRDNLSRQRK